MTRALAIVGPTTVGKTSLIARLRRKIEFELINLDSLQVYDYFRVGTGRTDLPATVRGHLYGFRDPRRFLSAGEYRDLAVGVLEGCNAPAVFEGGSISYLQALRDSAELELELELVGIPPDDPGRSRERVELRVDQCLDALIDEVHRALADGYGDTFVMSTPVVYRPVVDHVEGRVDRAICRELIVENLLEMAKSQLGYYRTIGVRWYDPSGRDDDQIAALVGPRIEKA